MQWADLERAIGFLGAIAAAAFFVRFTVRRGSLSEGGALTAAAIGLWVLYFSGPAGLGALVFFFVSSILWGRLSARRKVVSDAKHSQPRDFRQVLCNGGLYALLATFSGGNHQLVIVAMTVSLAASTADTWASEIGIYFRGRTFDLRTWRPTPAGLSGGVSWAGTLGGLAGAFALSVFSLLAFHWKWDWPLLALSTAFGFLGMLLDSLLGATLQARYRNAETGELTDIPTPILHSGYSWMSNDAVNLFSNILTVLLFVLYLLVFVLPAVFI